MKRMRPVEYGDDVGMRGGGYRGPPPPMDYGGGGMYPYHDPYGNLSPYGAGNLPAAAPREQQHPPPSDGLTQPQMMTLKQFLVTQDDSISDDIAITKYNEYKLEFKRNQLNEFFVAHKDEEW